MIYPYNVADTLILFQPKRTDYAHLLGLSPPCLESFRRAWIGYLLSPTYSVFHNSIAPLIFLEIMVIIKIESHPCYPINL